MSRFTHAPAFAVGSRVENVAPDSSSAPAPLEVRQAGCDWSPRSRRTFTSSRSTETVRPVEMRRATEICFIKSATKTTCVDFLVVLLLPNLRPAGLRWIVRKRTAVRYNGRTHRMTSKRTHQSFKDGAHFY